MMLAPACSIMLLLCALGLRLDNISLGKPIYRDIAPELKTDRPEITETDPTGKETSQFIASGGSATPPPRALGLPPWRKTPDAHKRYVWHVDLGDGEEPTTEPAPEVPSSATVMILHHDKAYDVNISVSVQESWTDAAGQTIYWLDIPKPAKTAKKKLEAATVRPKVSMKAPCSRPPAALPC